MVPGVFLPGIALEVLVISAFGVEGSQDSSTAVKRLEMEPPDATIRSRGRC